MALVAADCHSDRKVQKPGLCHACRRRTPDALAVRAAMTREQRHANADAERARRRAEYAANHLGRRDKALAEQRRRRLDPEFRIKRRSAKYGVPVVGLIEMLRWQAWSCAICRDDLTLDTAHIDHNHSTGEVRGLLCSPCNIAVGLIREEPSSAVAMSTYIRTAARR